MIVNKTYRYLLFLLLAIAPFMQCTKGFQALNTDPNSLLSVEPNFLLTTSLYSLADENITEYGITPGWAFSRYYNYACLELFVQHFTLISPPGSYAFGKFYSTYNATYDEVYWTNTYQNTFKTITQLLFISNDNPAYINYKAVAMILQAYTIQRLTDLYGDVPFTQAGQGYLKGIIYPEYDRQQDIYTAILNNLKTAVGYLNPTQPLLGDISNNNGSIAQWKQTAYSLMLRIAMRMIKVDPTNALAWATIAEDNLGTPATVTNAFYVQGTTQYFNPNYGVFVSPGQVFSYTNPIMKLSNVYIGLLKKYKDPRIFIWPTLRDANGNEPLFDSASQKGLNPSDNSSYDNEEYATFSQIRYSILMPTNPVFFISLAQTCFLLAELEERKNGIGAGKLYFKSGLTAAINQANFFGVSINTYLPPGTSITNYVDSITNFVYNQYSNLDSNLKILNEQYWLNSLFDGVETFANWRRTRTTSNSFGYPVLITPVGGGGLTGGVLPSRLIYPISERTVNPVNYNNAVSRLLAGDNLMSRIWWDVN
ncbi:MAG: SusD/RagB family nutrient-binding outer membrane lipoprotein [Phycisphaerales bacterium]|nr:SusD/RagB family nutrient-binding outer membrane lipoprotein [Phycisphaerales bacterium]